MITMTDNTVEVNQKAAIGSQTTQIAAQYNKYTGLSVTDATRMAFEIFREYYPQLKGEALYTLREMVKYELEKLQPKAIIPPKPKIAVPVLQNASITDENNVRKIYAKLLASSMNESTAQAVHPAFVTVVNQLNYYDAKVLEQVAEIDDTIPAASIYFTTDSEKKYLLCALPNYFSPYLYDSLDVWAVSMSLQNLSRLKIIDINDGNVTSYDYKQITNHLYIQSRFKAAQADNPEYTLEIKQSNLYIQTNDFGRQFLKICFPN